MKHFNNYLILMFFLFLYCSVQKKQDKAQPAKLLDEVKNTQTNTSAEEILDSVSTGFGDLEERNTELETVEGQCFQLPSTGDTLLGLPDNFENYFYPGTSDSFITCCYGMTFKTDDSVVINAFYPKKCNDISEENLSGPCYQILNKKYNEIGGTAEISFETDITSKITSQYYFIGTTGIYPLKKIFLRVNLWFGRGKKKPNGEIDNDAYYREGKHWELRGEIEAVESGDGYGFIVKNIKPEKLKKIIPVDVNKFDTLLWEITGTERDKLVSKSSYSILLNTDTLLFVAWDGGLSGLYCDLNYSLLQLSPFLREIEYIGSFCD